MLVVVCVSICMSNYWRWGGITGQLAADHTTALISFKSCLYCLKIVCVCISAFLSTAAQHANVKCTRLHGYLYEKIYKHIRVWMYECMCVWVYLCFVFAHFEVWLSKRTQRLCLWQLTFSHSTSLLYDVFMCVCDRD